MRLARIVSQVMQKNSNFPAIGEREKKYITDTKTGQVRIELVNSYRTITFGQMWAKAEAIANNWYRSSHSILREGDRVAIIAFTSGDYATIDLACIRLGAVSIHLQANSSHEQLKSIIEETSPKIIAASIEYLETAATLAKSTNSISQIVVFDYHHNDDEHSTILKKINDELIDSDRKIFIESLNEIIRAGERVPAAPFPADDENNDPLSMLIYTSGSTGSPKGAMYTEKLASGMWGGSWSKIFSDEIAITIHYMPMSHVAGHSSLKNTLARGGCSYFTSRSNLSSFFEDISLIRPTELSLVPRVCELIYQRYNSELLKIKAHERNDIDVEDNLMKEFKFKLLGGRVAWAGCASAPLSKYLSDFIESVLGIELHSIYGSTEAGVVWIDNKLMKPPVIDYKIIDAPELGYSTSDKPYPRGELLLKTESIIPGYYKRPELNAEIFDDEGYYITGDIVKEIGDGNLYFVDRRRNVVKLSQGEFIATANLETIYGASPLIKDIFIYANSEWSSPLAVIVPTSDVLKQYNKKESFIKRLMRDSLREIAKQSALKNYEIPRDFLIEKIPFGLNGLLSDHGKPIWPKLRSHYIDALTRLYENSFNKEAEALLDIYKKGEEQSVLDTLMRLAQGLVGEVDAGEISSDLSFREIGGDSLSAVHFSLTIEDIFDVRLPIDVLISPAYDLAYIAKYIDIKRNRKTARPGFSLIHGAAPTVVYANQLKLDRFLGERLRDGVATVQSAGEKTKILLTGASGYLGRFLCLRLMEELSKTGGELICIVRAKDDETARRRLEESFGTADSTLTSKYKSLANKYLHVMAGDIAESKLGLSEDDWGYLAEEVDAVFHVGALVNHVLPYKDMFEANVVGTAELISLAVDTKIKRFTFMSSIAVATPSDNDPALDEYSDIRQSLAYQSVDNSYANGYSLSKWAGEVLLREAHELYGLPVTVFRSSMILAHRDYRGQINVPDMFSRLLSSIINAKSAPLSFYKKSGDTPRPHYDGLPVDFISNAIINLSTENSNEYITYNLVNHHDDGISLDIIVDWLQTFGFDIKRTEQYGEWIGAFESSLKQFPDSLKLHSFLPLIDSIQEPQNAVSGSAIPSDRFREAMKRQGEGIEDSFIPGITKSLIWKYALDFKALGLFADDIPVKQE